VWARKFTVAHDCGLIINPDGLRRCIEGNVVQGTSRALSEEVTFDRAKVTSTDWTSYPILDITEAPEAVDIVLLNHPELPPAGAGESSIRPVAGRTCQRRLRRDRRAPGPARRSRLSGSSQHWRRCHHATRLAYWSEKPLAIAHLDEPNGRFNRHASLSLLQTGEYRR
jgi:hypothetical protein